MLFNSLEFFFFFAAVWALYLALRHRWQNRLLLIASYVFYGAWDVRFLTLIIASTLIDYLMGYYLAAEPGTERPRLVPPLLHRGLMRLSRKALVSVSVVANLGMLLFFRYVSFFAESLQELFAQFGLTMPPLLLDIVLPVGISFYTFQTMSYSLDIYFRRLKPTRSLEDFALFVAFFPQLVAGPIERASRLLPQVLEPRHITWERVNSGAWLVLQGTFKKVVVADNLAFMVNQVFAKGAEPTPWEIVIACYAFGWQIYGDFSGYSDVARGIARMMGFELMINFNLPLIATSPGHFWRRWHISLSTWLRDYVYIPMGGSKISAGRTYFNLTFTLLLAGAWHGPSINKFLFGAMQAVLVCGHRFSGPWLNRIAPEGSLWKALWWCIRVTVNFHIFAVCWIVFVPDDFSITTNLYSILWNAPWEVGNADKWVLPFCVLVGPMLLMHALQCWAQDLECVVRWHPLVRGVTYAATFLAIVLFGEDFGLPFFYFQF